MCKVKLVVVWLLAIVAALWVAPQVAVALPADKVRKIAMVFQCADNNQDCTPLGTYWTSLKNFIDVTLAQDVDSYNQNDFNNHISETPIIEYDLVIWYNSNDHLTWPDDVTVIVNAIKKYEMPTLVFDGNNFPISAALGLIPSGKTGATFGTIMYTLHREGYGDNWHGLITDNPEWATFDYTFQMVSVELVYTVDLSGPEDLTGNYKYTRPIFAKWPYYFSDEQMSLATTAGLVNDRRHIVALGCRGSSISPWEGCENGKGIFNSFNSIENFQPFINNVIAYLMTPAPNTPVVGQNTFTETDWTTQSRGFNFEIKRTYRSGNTDSRSGFTGGGWSTNLVQYVVWDRFNDTLLIRNGSGEAIQMELVQGERPEHPAFDETRKAAYRMFTTVNAPDQQVAVYYPAANSSPETLENLPLNGRNEYNLYYDRCDRCTNFDHSERTGTPGHQEGFLVRDAQGNKAFFARSPQNYDWPDYFWSDDKPPGIYYNENIWTRGGELAYFHLTYMEDASGNRQEYFYNAHYSPEGMLDCVVDTEGRGYYIDNVWYGYNFEYGKHLPTTGMLINSITMPLAVRANGLDKIEYGYTESFTPRGSLYLTDVRWLDGEELVKHKHYDFGLNSPLCTECTTECMALCLCGGWFTRRLLTAVYEGDPTAGAGTDTLRKTMSFKYYDYVKENYLQSYHSATIPFPGFWRPEWYPGQLKMKIVYGMSDTNKTVSEYEYHLKDGHPNLDDLDEPYAAVWETKNGVRKATVMNGRHYVIMTHEAFAPERIVSGDPLDGITNEMQPESCAEIPSSHDPATWTNCPGWRRVFTTNFDGQITSETSSFNSGLFDEGGYPKGRTTSRLHLVDTVFSTEVQSMDNIPADNEMLNFWKNGYWYLRFWLANEKETVIKGNNGQTMQIVRTKYDPVYNKPVKIAFVNGVTEYVQRLLWYDYLVNGTVEGDAQSLFQIMYGNTSGTDMETPYPWPSYLSVDDKIFNGITWCSLCNRAVIDTYDDKLESKGTRICEVLPATTAHGDSAARSAAAVHYAYDDYGREIYSRSTGGREVLNDYWEVPDDENIRLYKAVTRLGDFSSPDMRIVYGYRRDGQIIEQNTGGAGTGLSVDPLLQKKRFVYDALGNTIEAETFNGTGVRLQHDLYKFDTVGNKVVIAFDRCPSTCICNGEYQVQMNDAGDELLHLFAFDRQGRMIADCVERNEGLYDCTQTRYQADDLVGEEKKYEACDFSSLSYTSEPDDIQNSLAGIDTSCASGLRQTRSFAYDGRNRQYQLTVTDPADPLNPRSTQTWYNVDNKLAALRDAADSDGSGDYEWTHLEYDSKSRLKRRTEGLTVLLEKIPTGMQIATTYQYDFFDNVIAETVGKPDISTYANNAFYGKKEHTYDERQARVATKTYLYTVGTAPPVSSGYIITYNTLNQDNQVVLTTTRKYASGPTLKYTSHVHTDYDIFGRVEQVEDDFRSTTVIFYHDEMDNVVREEHYDKMDPEPGEGFSNLYLYDYDALGQKTASWDVNVDNESDVHPTFYSYDGYGYLVATVNPRGQETVYSRDGRGNATTVYERFTNGPLPWYFENGGDTKDYKNTSPYEVAILDSVIQNKTTYDSFGNVTTRTDDHGNQSAWTYNGFGEIKSEKRPDSFEKHILRNRDGAITQIAYKKGSTVERVLLQVLDMYNRTIALEVNGSLVQTFTYHNNGLPATWTDYCLDQPTSLGKYPDIVYATRTWDTLGNIINDHQKHILLDNTNRGWTTSAVFTGNLMTSMTLPTAIPMQTLVWDYGSVGLPDSVGRLRIAQEKFGLTPHDIASFAWSGDKLVDRTVTIRTGVTTSHNRTDDGTPTGVPLWDGFGRLEGQKYLINSDVASKYVYTYNENDRLIHEDYVGNTDDDIAYVLDHLDRVKHYNYRRTKNRSYNYDEANNLRQSYDPAKMPISQTQTRDFDILNDMTGTSLNQIGKVYKVGNQTTPEQIMTYDVFGNLTAIDKPGTVNDLAYTWDRLGRLIAVSKGGVVRARFMYDAMGRRTYKHTYNAVGTFVDQIDYHLYGDNVVEEKHFPGSGNQWLLVVHHDPTGTDRYLRWDKYVYSGSWNVTPARLAPMTDIRNNVKALVNDLGVVVDNRFYDLYGYDEITSPIPNNYFPYRFAGRQYDPETGLYYNRTRYYSPDLGRFISLDTIGIWGDLNNYGNGYAYVGGMANGLVDPFGNQTELGASMKKQGENKLRIAGLVNALINRNFIMIMVLRGEPPMPVRSNNKLPDLAIARREAAQAEAALARAEATLNAVQRTLDALKAAEDAAAKAKAEADAAAKAKAEADAAKDKAEADAAAGSSKPSDIGGSEEGGGIVAFIEWAMRHGVYHGPKGPLGGGAEHGGCDNNPDGCSGGSNSSTNNVPILGHVDDWHGDGDSRGVVYWRDFVDWRAVADLGVFDNSGGGGGDPLDDYFNPLADIKNATGHGKGGPPPPAPTGECGQSHKQSIQDKARRAGSDLENWSGNSLQGHLNLLMSLTHGKVGPAVDPPPFDTFSPIQFFYYFQESAF